MKNKEYRTIEQFEEITESMINGNWDQAADQCVEYGFSINDLQEHYIELELDIDIWGYARVIALAQEIRNKSHSN